MKKWIYLAAAAAALLWWFGPFAATQPPILISPADTAFLQWHPVPPTSSSSPVTFKWRHGGRNLANPRARPAPYFVLCVDDPAILGEKCGEGAADNFVMDWKARADIPRAQVGGFPPDPVYEYSYKVDFDDTVLDLQLYWTVGACSAMNNLNSCNFATPSRTLFLNGSDLHAYRIDDDAGPGPTNFTIAVEMENLGETDFAGGKYDVATNVWEILADPNNCTLPLTDVNKLNRAGTPVDESIEFSVIMKDGTVSSVLNLPLVAGGRDSSEVNAIIRLNGIKESWAYKPTVASDTEGATSADLNAGDPTLAIKPCKSSERTPSGSGGRCVINVPADPAFAPRAFAARTRIDPQDMIPEYDETNNQAMRNDIRVYPPDATPGMCTVDLFEKEE